MNMRSKVACSEAESVRLFGGLDTSIPKASQPAFELESHIFGIVSRHGAMRRCLSTGQGIITATDDDGRVFKVEISQVAGPA